MPTPSGYNLGLDDEGTIHVQALFEGSGPEDLSFRWQLSFILYQEHPYLDEPPGTVPEASALRWGLWDGHRVLWATSDLRVAAAAISALLEKGHFLADTILPNMVEGYSPESAMLIYPSFHQERIELKAADRETLRSQRELVR